MNMLRSLVSTESRNTAVDDLMILCSKVQIFLQDYVFVCRFHGVSLLSSTALIERESTLTQYHLTYGQSISIHSSVDAVSELQASEKFQAEIEFLATLIVK